VEARFLAALRLMLSCQRALVQAGVSELTPSVVLVDPPRAGLDDATVELIRKIGFPFFIFNVNPEKHWKSNLESLSSTQK